MAEKNKEPLSIEEAERRVQYAVDYLEGEINRIDGTPGKRDVERRKQLASILMTSLAEKYSISPPK